MVEKSSLENPHSGVALASSSNFEIFKESLAPAIYRKWKAASVSTVSAKNRNSNHAYDEGDANADMEELSDFIDYLADESFPYLPPAIQSVKYDPSTEPPSIALSMLDSIPLPFVESLVSYGIVSDEEDSRKLLLSVIGEYVKEATKPPPVWVSTRKEECEICERRVPVTYHHLIPRSVHAKVLRRGWHEEWMLNSVAWLCRPCHSMCHKVADNETLAREYYTVERLLEREDIQRWASYISKRRFKVRGR